jgi:hypothetical protein
MHHFCAAGPLILSRYAINSPGGLSKMLGLQRRRGSVQCPAASQIYAPAIFELSFSV